MFVIAQTCYHAVVVTVADVGSLHECRVEIFEFEAA